DQPKVISFRSNLAKILSALGELQSGADARASFTKAQALDESIVAEVPAVPRYQSDLAMTLMLFGSFARNSKAYPEAVALHERAVKISEALARDHSDMVQYQLSFADSLSHLGLTLVDARRPGDALPRYERAIEVYETVLRKNPTDIGTTSL